jgi:hypothetical protein
MKLGNIAVKYDQVYVLQECDVCDSLSVYSSEYQYTHTHTHVHTYAFTLRTLRIERKRVLLLLCVVCCVCVCVCAHAYTWLCLYAKLNLSFPCVEFCEQAHADRPDPTC